MPIGRWLPKEQLLLERFTLVREGSEGMDSLLKAEGISKRFGGIQALNKVNFEVGKAEVHALVGENGAGKSTLMKIITGVYQKDEGELWFNGAQLVAKDPLHCRTMGIGIVFQEPTLIWSLDVKRNIFLGRYPTKRIPGVMNLTRLKELTCKVLEELDIDIDPDTPVGQLTFGKRQMIEIAKVMAHNAKLVILDEPTSALSEVEKENLFRIIRRVKEKGTSVIYISHRLEEIFEISDRITVLRDGNFIGTDLTENLTVNSLIKMMIGRTLGPSLNRQNMAVTEKHEIFRVEGLSRGKALKNISFNLQKGEILGISGLIGSGRTELARAIFGIDRMDSGKLYLNGQQVVIRSPIEAVRQGLGFVSESRKEQGIIPRMGTGLNISLTILGQFSKFSVVDWSQQQDNAKSFIEKLRIKVASLAEPVVNLSGGNQQKVVVAKWLASNPQILILDEPTRGIDVGAKAEIHHLIAKLAEEGLSVIIISSEMEEVIKLSDRVLVMYEGAVSRVLNREEISEENLLNCIHGHK
jgi:ribose transport system ATP-binding protein